MKRALLLVGPPGSGKGTQAKKLAHVADLYHLSSGDIFRAIPKDSKESALQQEYIVKGQLVPDQVTLDICLSYIEGLEKTFKFDRKKQLLLLDGIPRTKNQAELLKKEIEMGLKLPRICARLPHQMSPMLDREVDRNLAARTS